MSEDSILRELNAIGAKLDRMESRLDRASYDMEAKLSKIIADIDRRIDEEAIKHRTLELKLVELEAQFKPIKAFSYMLGASVVTAIMGAIYNFILKRPGGFP